MALGTLSFVARRARLSADELPNGLRVRGEVEWFVSGAASEIAAAATELNYQVNFTFDSEQNRRRWAARAQRRLPQRARSLCALPPTPNAGVTSDDGRAGAFGENRRVAAC